MTTKSHNRQAIPQSFWETVYTHRQLIAILAHAIPEIDEAMFWGFYAEGRFPFGVSLMSLTGVPLLVWPRDDIKAWLAAGMPEDPSLAERTRRVMADLRAAMQE